MQRLASLNALRTAIMGLGMFGSMVIGPFSHGGQAEAGEPHDGTKLEARRVKGTPSRPDLATVEIQIKDVMNQIARKQQEEARIQDGVSTAGDSGNQSTDKAVESHRQLVDATKLFD